MQIETDPVNDTATVAAIEKACNLLGHYYILKTTDMFDNSSIPHIVLERNVLDACRWVCTNTCFGACRPTLHCQDLSTAVY